MKRIVTTFILAVSFAIIAMTIGTLSDTGRDTSRNSGSTAIGASVADAAVVPAAAPDQRIKTTPVAYAAQTAASKAKTPKRYIAMRWAKTIHTYYLYGGNGPRYDCSGLVKAAYAKAGISLPRVAADQASSSKTVTVSKKNAKWGYLVFFGSGHVELFGHIDWKHGKIITYGAHRSGTRVSYSTRPLGSATSIQYVKGAQ